MSKGLRDASLHAPQPKERKRRMHAPPHPPKPGSSPIAGEWSFTMPKRAEKKPHATRHTRGIK